MENNFNGALEDISIIKKSINGGKVNLKAIYKLFLINAIIKVTVFFTENILSEIFLLKGGTNLYSKFTSLISIILLIMNVGFFIYYVKTYKKEKLSSNKYYISFLSLFGVIKFIIPFFIRIFIILTPLRGGNNEEFMSMINSIPLMTGAINILFLYLCLNLLGEIVNKNSYKVISIIILLGYFALVMFLGDSRQIITINYVTRYKFYLGIYISLLNLIVALIMPITLKFEERRSYGIK